MLRVGVAEEEPKEGRLHFEEVVGSSELPVSEVVEVCRFLQWGGKDATKGFSLRSSLPYSATLNLRDIQDGAHVFATLNFHDVQDVAHVTQVDGKLRVVKSAIFCHPQLS